MPAGLWHCFRLLDHGLRRGSPARIRTGQPHRSVPDVAAVHPWYPVQRATEKGGASVTPFDDLRQRYDDGTWTRARFADKHILFQERSGEYDYMEGLFSGQPRRRGT